MSEWRRFREAYAGDEPMQRAMREALPGDDADVAALVTATVQFARGRGFAVEPDEVQRFLDTGGGRELSDDELDHVAGGGVGMRLVPSQPKVLLLAP